jgi:serine/threonine protein kinase
MNAPPPSDTSRSAAASLIGKTIAQRYLVKKRIGKGAMGSVFLAEHIVLKCPYALKILHPELASHEETVHRFIREAQTTASINHPNVCASTDFGKLPDGSFYLVMEYLRGQTLRKLNKTTPTIPPERAIHITTQMLNALGRAHDLGIVHRDLKPENIMLITKEQDPDFVKIMDFGLASLVPKENDEERARLTMTGIVYGTPVYMSPEQVRAELHIDGRADLYAIGAMFFEMLTGSIPFQGPNITALLAQHLTEPVCSIRERTPHLDLPAALDPIIARAMAKKADDRFKDAQEFIDALEAADLHAPPDQEHLVDTNEVTPPVIPREVTEEMTSHALTPTARPLRENSSRTKKLVAIGLSAVALIGLIGVLVALSINSPTPEPLPDDPELRAQALITRATDTLTSQRVERLEDTPVLKSALAKLDGESPEEARDMLLAIEKEHIENPHYHYILGQAYFQARQKPEALDAYTRAIKLEASYFYEDTLFEHLVLLLSDEDEELSTQAQRLITNERLATIVPLLGERAQHISGRKRREALRDYLVSTHTMAELPAWRIAAIELRTAVGCKAHGDAIKSLAESDDVRALEPLIKLDAKPKRGCGKRKNKDCFGCVRQELTTAISVLEAKFPGGLDAVETSPDDPDQDLDDEQD